MQLAFYAPMKPPDHPNPSGDRTIARSLLRAFDHMGAGTTLASRLRSREGNGNSELQGALIKEAKAEVDRILANPEARTWNAWVTYHNYYKAPDLVGPAVTSKLGIPYVQIESTRAKKRLGGAWDTFARASETAADAAALVYYVSERDGFALKRDAPQGQLVRHLHPFLPLAALPDASSSDGPMLSVGMMRPGDKLASYQIIANALGSLQTEGWQLAIAGDGPMRDEVRVLFAPFGQKVSFLGELDETSMREAYGHASVLFWPGVNEALGQVYLEAQAAGVPVVAQDRPGMRDLLAPGFYPDPDAGPGALAARLDVLLLNRRARLEAGEAARQFVKAKHLLPTAAQILRDGLAELGVTA